MASGMSPLERSPRSLVAASTTSGDSISEFFSVYNPGRRGEVVLGTPNDSRNGNYVSERVYVGKTACQTVNAKERRHIRLTRSERQIVQLAHRVDQPLKDRLL